MKNYISAEEGLLELGRTLLVGQQLHGTALVHSALDLNLFLVVDVVVAHLLLRDHLVNLGLLLLLRGLAVGRYHPLRGRLLLLLLGLVADGRHGRLVARKIVAFEQLLELRLPQQERIFLDQFGLLLILDGDLLVLVEIAFLHHGYKGRFDVLALQLLPVQSREPGVVFNFPDAVETQPVLGLSLDQFVDEVCSLEAPVLRNIVILELHLLGKHEIPDLIA